MEMKTLEITTESGTYLVVDLPDSARVLWVRENFIRIEYTLEYWNCPVEQNVLIPPAKWSKIGSGKDHPKLVEELPIQTELFHRCAYGCAANDNSCGLWQSNKCDSEIESELKYVFKNPFILEKQ